MLLGIDGLYKILVENLSLNNVILAAALRIVGT